MKPRLFVSLILFSIASTNAYAKDDLWKSNTGINPRGLSYASMYVSKHEFGMGFSCNENDKNTGMLHVQFSGTSLPRLYAADGEKAKLRLIFDLGNGDAHVVPWNSYFVSDSPDGSGAWLGEIRAGRSMLNALSAARKLLIKNSEGELVYQFGTKRTSVGVKAIRAECGLGQ